jgi:hypothetical protein
MVKFITAMLLFLKRKYRVTGGETRDILPETDTFFHSHQIRLIAQKTGQAWKTFNELSNSEKVLGAFHLTC